MKKGLKIVLGLGALGAVFLGGFWARGMMGGEGEVGGEDGGEVQWYVSGMHPWIIRPEPGNCPICGMELTPLDSSMLAGELAVDPVVVRNMGVRVTKATSGPAAREIWAPVEVVADESSVARVVARAGGFVERLFRPRVGDSVERGEALAELHSPQIIAAAHELLAVAEGGSEGAVEMARNRLRILGVAEAEIEGILAGGEVPRTVTVFSPGDGYVREVFAREGAWVESGGALAEIVGRDPVWAVTTVAQNGMDFAREGTEVEMEFSAFPGEVFWGRVDFVYEELRGESRRARMRTLLENAEGRLLPGMLGRAKLRAREGDEVIRIPDAAVVDSGEREIVFVSLGGGRFEPREIVAGMRLEGGMLEVKEGIAAGEKVVVSGQFLLESESRMREALLKMVEGEPAVVGAEAAELQTTKLDPFLEGAELGRVVEVYLEIGEALAGDRMEGVAELGERLDEAAVALQEGNEDAELAAVLAELRAGTHHFSHAGEIGEARMALRDLSEPLRLLLRAVGAPPGVGAVFEFRCPMFPEMGEHAYWLQGPGAAENPYMGGAMLRCMDQRVELPAMGNGEISE